MNIIIMIIATIIIITIITTTPSSSYKWWAAQRTVQKYSLEKYVCCEYIWAKMLCEDILVKIENILQKESVILHAREVLVWKRSYNYP